jgi:hypothetical protein
LEEAAMGELDGSFGELRAALAASPSPFAWEAVCRCCERAALLDRAAFEEALLPYAQQALAGWPDALRTTPPRWLAAAGGDVPGLPLVRHLELAHPPGGWPMAAGELLDAPGLRHVTQLKVAHLSLGALRGCALLAQVQHVDLGASRRARAELEVIEQMPRLVGLRAADADTAVGALAELERLGWLGRMEALELGPALVTARGLEWLASCARLRSLGLWGGALRVEEVGRLCEALEAAPLEGLNVGGCGLDGAGLAKIAQTRWRLRDLGAWGARLGRAEVELLAQAEAFEGLERLNLRRALSGGALAPLLARRGATALRVLEVHGCALDAQSWRAASQGDVMRGLVTLGASEAGISDDVTSALVDGLGGGRIEALELSRNLLRGETAHRLARASLPQLRSLALDHTRIGDAGLSGLLEAPWIGGLEVLDVVSCELSLGAEALFKGAAHRLKSLRYLALTLAAICEPEPLERRMLPILPQVEIGVHG